MEEDKVYEDRVYIFKLLPTPSSTSSFDVARCVAPAMPLSESDRLQRMLCHFLRVTLFRVNSPARIHSR